MKRIEHCEIEYSFRWPWRVTVYPYGAGFSARVPRWGRWYVRLMRLLGVRFVTWRPLP